MVAVIGSVEDVSVVQLPELLQFLINSLHRHIDALQGLQTLCHQNIGELPVDRLHFFGDLKDPLFVGVRREVV